MCFTLTYKTAAKTHLLFGFVLTWFMHGGLSGTWCMPRSCSDMASYVTGVTCTCFCNAVSQQDAFLWLPFDKSALEVLLHHLPLRGMRLE